jgi:hypothetical protein
MADLVTVAEVVERWPAFAKFGAGQQSALISDVSGIVEAEFGYSLDGATLTETLSGTGYPKIWLRQWPVVSVESVAIDGTALPSEGWDLDPETGELYRGSGRWPRGYRNVVVSYTVAGSVVAGLKRAAALTIQYYAELPKATGLFKQEIIGPYQYVLADKPIADSIPPAARAIFSKLAKMDAIA